MAAITGPHCRPGLDPGPSTAGVARRCLDRLDPGSALRAVRGDKWGLLRSGSSEYQRSSIGTYADCRRQTPLPLAGEAGWGAASAPAGAAGEARQGRPSRREALPQPLPPSGRGARRNAPNMSPASRTLVECPGSALPSPNPDSGIGSRQRPLVSGRELGENSGPGRARGQGWRTSRPAALRSMMARSAAGASSSGSSEETCGRMRPAAAQSSSASAEARSRSGRRLR